jgi:hypothetical protein
VKKTDIILLTAFILELGFLTFFRGIAGIYISPMVLFVLSLFIGVFPMVLLIKNKDRNYPVNKILTDFRLKWIISLTAFVAGITVLIIVLAPVFTNNIAYSENNDIIPVIKIMNQRFLQGVFPYQPIDFSGHTVFCPYMPLQWMPFMISEVLKMDYRWLAFIVWVISIVIYHFSLTRRKYPLFYFILLSLLPYITLLIYIRYVPEAFENSIELLITGYYIFLALSIFSASVFNKTTSLIMTLLSRFSDVLWVPFYIILLFFKENKKKALTISIITLFAIILIYILPFVGNDRNIFQKSQRYRTQITIEKWKAYDINKPEETKINLYNGVGFAGYFYSLFNGDIKHKVRGLQKHHLIFSILSILFLGIIFLIFHELIDYKIFLLLGLKIHFAFFYNFIQVPYMYLFLVPVFLSLIVLMVWFDRKVEA